ncbi:MAG: DNA mismatch repair protein MutS [Clostridia bacterium]|nr:DNA mismatch repair protein MutS [Clostridia bacterium]
MESLSKIKTDSKLSDMMRHYVEIKDKYPDCVLFYRLGDFYEMFFDDAVEVSRLLELTLTGRDCGLSERAPMCGVPFHAADAYIAKLVALGKKVAVCEQLSDPKDKAGKKLVERDVIRIVSNGTITEDQLFDDKTNNFIACICAEKDAFGISWADITTGDFVCEQVEGVNALCDSLFRIDPAETIFNTAGYEVFNGLSDVVRSSFKVTSKFDDDNFDLKYCKNILCEQFDVEDIRAFVPTDKPLAVRAAGGLISYTNKTQKRKVGIFSRLSYYTSDAYVQLDSTAIKNLELTASMRDGKPFGSLLWAIDKTLTAGGGRKIKEILLSPLRDKKMIDYRLDGVDDLFNNSLCRASLTETMRQVFDLERLCGRISNGLLSPRDCEKIRFTLQIIPSVRLQLTGLKSQILKDICDNLGEYEAITDILVKAIKKDPPVTAKDGNFINDGFDERLDKYRSLEKNAKNILEDMQAKEREATGIKTLKIAYNKVFGYYIEVTNSYLEQVPYNYIRKQTLVGAERFVTEELKSLEEEILTSGEKAVRIENEIFDKLKATLEKNVQKMLKTAKCLSMLDVLLSFSQVARSRGYVRPTITDYGKPMNIVGGRHPVVEAGGKITFVPNDTYVDCDENRMMIITGPNMAGKSTYMRQVALIAIMAHMGCFVPAKEAEIPLTDKIFTRVGASDNLLFNQSTFMVEMSEVAGIVANATKDSLLILDEVGRGTSTFDGLSIAWAVVEYLAGRIKAKTLFATHYHELSELEGTVEGVKNYKITVKEINGEIVFLRKIARGSANKSFGIEVAALSGIPNEITRRAKSILNSLEKNDITVKGGDEPNVGEIKKSFAEDYIEKLDLNNLTPLRAFEILSYLKSKL